MADMVDHQYRDLSLKERKGLLDLMIYVGYADGHHGREQERLHIVREQLGLGKKYTHKRLGRAARGTLKVELPESDEGRRLSLELMIKMMKADRDVAGHEVGVFYEVAESYGMAEDEVREMLEKHFPGYQLTRRGEPGVISKMLASGSGGSGKSVGEASALNLGGSLGRIDFLGLASLIIANLIPLAGVLFLEWSVSYIMILYWIENVVIGIISAAKIRDLKRMPAHAKLKMTMFGVFHYGAFVLAHGYLLLMFIVAVEVGPEEKFHWVNALGVVAEIIVDTRYFVIVAIVFMFIDHWLAFQRQVDVWEEYVPDQMPSHMLMPYLRVIILHITLLFGAMVAAAEGAPEFMIVALVLFKLLVDLGMFWYEYKKSLKAAGMKQNRIVMR